MLWLDGDFGNVSKMTSVLAFKRLICSYRC
jgi:hypothetical protein